MILMFFILLPIVMSQIPPKINFASSSCSLTPDIGHVSNPKIFGWNDVLGPIINLTYNNPHLISAIKALRVGVLRYPGGTVANYWSMQNGSYVGTNGSNCHGVDGNGTTRWNYCSHEDRIDALPKMTFTPKNFWFGVGSASPTTSTDGVIFDLNVFSLSKERALAQLDVLKKAEKLGVPVRYLEFGNEFYINKDYGWHFASVGDYMKAATPIIQHARTLFPKAKIGVVGQNGGSKWDEDLIKYRDLFDAITIHDYSPNIKTVLDQPSAYQKSVIAGWGEGALIKMTNDVRKVFGKKCPEVWRTEYNYGSLSQTLPPVYDAGGALHGIFLISHILATIQHSFGQVPFTVLQIHALAHQDSAKWTPLDRVALNLNDPKNIRVNAVGQIFAHVAHFALEQHHTMHSIIINTTGCPKLPQNVEVYGTKGLPCVQAAAFTEKISVGFVIINKCPQIINVTLHTLLEGSGTMNITTYEASTTKDMHNQDNKWVPIPTHDEPFPWKSGPLFPYVRRNNHIADTRDIKIQLPAISITLVRVSSDK